MFRRKNKTEKKIERKQRKVIEEMIASFDAYRFN